MRPGRVDTRNSCWALSRTVLLLPHGAILFPEVGEVHLVLIDYLFLFL